MLDTVSRPLMIFGISVSLALHFLAITLFYFIGFAGTGVHIYESNFMIAMSEFFLIAFGLSINMILLKQYLR
jgi:hypothetical protein